MTKTLEEKIKAMSPHHRDLVAIFVDLIVEREKITRLTERVDRLIARVYAMAADVPYGAKHIATSSSEIAGHGS